jgi:hypothetical protein
MQYLFSAYMENAPPEARHLLAPYAPASVDLLCDIIGFSAHTVFDDMRKEAAGALPTVLAALACAVPPGELAPACAAVTAAAPDAKLRNDFKPANEAQYFVRALYVTLDTLGACLTDDEDPPTFEVQVALLRAVKDVLHGVCSHAAFFGAPPSPGPLSPLLSGAARAAALFFPLLAKDVMDDLALGTRGVVRAVQQRRALRRADERVTLLEALSRAFPTLSEAQVATAADGAGGDRGGAVAAARTAAGGVAPVPGALDDADADEEAEEDAEEKAEADAALVHGVMDVWGAIARTQGAAWVPTFNTHVSEDVMQLGARFQPLVDRRIFLFVMDDLLEHCGEGAVTREGAHWAEHAVPQLVVDAACGDAPLRQAAAYGLGVAAVACPAAFSPHGGAAVAALFSSLDAYAQRAPTCERLDEAHDNAVTALLRIAGSCMAPGDSARGAVLERALGLLPLTQDWEEASFSARLLCAWLQGGDAQLLAALGLGGDAQRLACVLAVLAKAVSPLGLDGDMLQQRTFGVCGFSQPDRVASHVAAALAHLEGAAPALLRAAAALLPDAKMLARLQRVKANPGAAHFEE